MVVRKFQYLHLYNCGFTLIELMASIVISLVILAGVVQSFFVSKSIYDLQEEMARMQDNSRFALDLLVSEIRMAGYTGCGSATKTTNILLEAGAWDNGYPGVFGYESKDVPESFTKHVTGQDALVVRRADGDERAKVVAHRTSLAVFKVEKINIIDRGSIMLIADSSCQGVGMFRGEINHSLGEVSYGLSLGNCTDNLSFGGDCRNFPEELGQPYTVGSTIMPMVIRAYYISKNSQGVPSLYMKPVFADGSSVKQELVEGVEGMQITYGADENVDGAVDVYKKADEIMDWQGVKSVRIELLIRSINAVGEGSVDYIFNSESYSDRYVRQIASSTIMLRNR